MKSCIPPLHVTTFAASNDTRRATFPFRVGAGTFAPPLGTIGHAWSAKGLNRQKRDD
jgi:hypothetical protein